MMVVSSCLLPAVTGAAVAQEYLVVHVQVKRSNDVPFLLPLPGLYLS